MFNWLTNKTIESTIKKIIVIFKKAGLHITDKVYKDIYITLSRADKIGSIEKLIKKLLPQKSEHYTELSDKITGIIMSEDTLMNTFELETHQPNIKDIYFLFEKMNADFKNFNNLLVKLMYYNSKYNDITIKNTITKLQYYNNLIFQIVMALITFQDYFMGMHHDLNMNNIMIKMCDDTLFNNIPLKDIKYFEYEVFIKTKNNKKKKVVYKIPNLGFIVKIGDLGHANIIIKNESTEDEMTFIKYVNDNVIIDYIKDKEAPLTKIFKQVGDFFGTQFIDEKLILSQVQKVAKSRIVRNYNLSTDLSTIFNHLAQNKETYRNPIVSEYFMIEKNKVKKHGKMDIWAPTKINNSMIRSITEYTEYLTPVISYTTPKDLLMKSIFFKHFLIKEESSNNFFPIKFNPIQ